MKWLSFPSCSVSLSFSSDCIFCIIIIGNGVDNQNYFDIIIMSTVYSKEMVHYSPDEVGHEFGRMRTSHACSNALLGELTSDHHNIIIV
jgi:hypothetical protein